MKYFSKFALINPILSQRYDAFNPKAKMNYFTIIFL